MKNKHLLTLLFLLTFFISSVDFVKAIKLEDDAQNKQPLQPRHRLMQMYFNSFKDYTEQVRDHFVKLKETCPKDIKVAVIFKSLQLGVDLQESNINWAKKGEESLHQIEREEITPSKVLYNWLGQRHIVLQDLKKRNDADPSAFRTSELTHFLGISDPKCPHKVEVSVGFGEFIGRLATKTSNDQFVLFNHLIASLYNITPVSALSLDVKRLIAASPSLWPLLRGESSESLDLDESVGDVLYFENCICKNESQIVQLMNWTRNEFITIHTTREEAGLSKVKLPTPDWLYPVVRVDEKGQEIVMAPSKRKKKKKAKPVQHLEQIPPTPVISLEKPLSEDTFVQMTPQLCDEDPVEQHSELPPVEVISNLPARGNRIFHPHSQDDIAQETIISFEEKLNSTHRKLLETIFDNKLNGQGFCYREVESLWEHLNGKGTLHATGRGSSHRVFEWDPNQDGNFVKVGSTFTHGPNHTYTSKTVRYIRDAFIAIGYPWGK